MPTIRLSALDILGIRGPALKPVFTRRKKTQVLRRPYGRTTPSPAQIVVRNAFRLADAHWAYLTLLQRQAWRDYRSWEKINGYSQYMRINIPRTIQGLPFQNDAPTI